MNEGDVICIHTANGGGYGDPRRRRRELVLDDLRNGYVTEETARIVYGVETIRPRHERTRMPSHHSGAP